MINFKSYGHHNIKDHQTQSTPPNSPPPPLKDVPFEYIENRKIGLLIGMNMPELMYPLKTIPQNNNMLFFSPYVTLHKLGWTLQDPIQKTTDEIDQPLCHVIEAIEIESLNRKIEKLFSRDFTGSNDEELGLSVEDRIWHQRVEHSLKKLPDERYEIGLPLGQNRPSLPSNRYQVLARFQSLKKLMLSNNEFSNEYIEFMKSMIENNFVEKVPDAELSERVGNIWYLVHHRVYHKQKKKLRIVFDASLKCHQVSLNSELLQGPDLTTSLLAVLLRFRQEKVAVIGDIAKMFYQINVPKQHRDFLRFFWFLQNDPNQPPIEYRLKVLVFGAVS